MKKCIKTTLLASMVTVMSQAQQIQNLASFPAGDYDVVRVNNNPTAAPTPPGFLKRLGHLEAGTWGNGPDTWLSLGRPVGGPSVGMPQAANLYGLTVNDVTDRAFFGIKNISQNRADGIIAWGDDDINAGITGPDRFVFEFHHWSNPPVNALTLMPNGSAGVYAGLGVYTPQEQLHTTGGVLFAGLTSGGSPNALVGIDANGKLWRTGMPTSGIGNLCGSPQNPIAGNYEVPLGSFDFHFTGDNTNSDKVNIGIPCTAAPQWPGKLNVTTNFQTNIINNESFGIYAKSQNPVRNANNTGVYGEANSLGMGVTGTLDRGVWGRATGEGRSIGVYGEALIASGTPGGGGYGGYFTSTTSGGVSYGVFAEALNAGTNYGIFATAGGINNGGAGPNYAGYFDGDVVSTITGYLISDKRLKKDIKKIESSLSIIDKLNPVTYNFDYESNKWVNLSSYKQYGFISQDVQEVLPELTKTVIHPAKYDGEGNQIYPEKEILALNYNGFIAILAKGIQEQQKLIESQNKRIESLESILASPTDRITQSSTATGQINVSLSDKNSIVLDQNVPNPFAESTMISYSIPTDFTKAQIIFSTNEGRVIRVVDITAKGDGQLSIFANDLTHGIYTYTLVIDGKTIESKKMIKE